MNRSSWISALFLAFLVLAGKSALADEPPDSQPIPVPRKQEVPWDVIEDRILKGMHALDEIAPFEDKAPLWDHMDAKLQKQVDEALKDLGLMDDARRKRLAVVLVDATDLARPR